jgi:L-aminopeptidase/D-esterase-like protein
MPKLASLPMPDDRLSIAGLTLGHGSDTEGMTGVTVILCPQGATAAAEVRGTATGTRQFDSLNLTHALATKIHGVVLAGGSGFGLSCADPVVAHLERGGFGFDTGLGIVPLVPTAILFDLGFGDPAARPGPELVEAALLSAAAGKIVGGSLGVGTGATVGKALGPANGMKGGFGFASYGLPEGPTVAAAVAVNAFGDVRHPDTGRWLAGCRESSASLVAADARRVMMSLPPVLAHAWEGNTTLAVVMTDADLDKAALRKVCEMAFGGLYRCLVPALSLYDGDLVLALATREVDAHVHQVGTLAEMAVARAIVRAVEEADGFGLLPAFRDLNEDAPGGGVLDQPVAG